MCDFPPRPAVVRHQLGRRHAVGPRDPEPTTRPTGEARRRAVRRLYDQRRRPTRRRRDDLRDRLLLPSREGGIEADDAGREGRVFAISARRLGRPQTLRLPPLFEAGIAATPGTGAFPNQLYACAIYQDRLYVGSVGASPEPFENRTDFRQNIQGLIHELDLSSGPAVTNIVNLNQLVDEQAAPRRFASVPVDLAFSAGSPAAWVASILSNSLLRVDFGADPVRAGSETANFLGTGLSPTGVAISGGTAYVYNLVSRSVTAIDLASQAAAGPDVESAPQPFDADERSALRGQRFFNTGLARWSANGWVGCIGCHPFGTTDNVTWTFPAGPRQTVDTSATFDRSGNIQRILNWTAIFDEIHDFELNTRGVANGTGAIVSSADLNADGSPNLSARIDFVGPGGVANPANAFNGGSAKAVAESGATPEDWNDIEAFIKSIRSPRAAVPASRRVERGRRVFEEEGRCQYCHGGVLWTLAERYYAPELDQDFQDLSLAEAGVEDLGAVPASQVSSTNPAGLSVIAPDANGAPLRHTCTVRIVGTFGARGPDDRGALEIRQNGGNAQGIGGFNVPSLLGTSMGAPYLHNGAAETLEDLFDPQGLFQTHLRAGNPGFHPSRRDVANLIAFLRSIDEDTEVIPVPDDLRFCPEGL